MADLIQFPKGFGEQDIVAWGTTGLVCRDAASQTVTKTPHDDGNSRRVEVEKKIYEGFDQCGRHSGLLRYQDLFEEVITALFKESKFAETDTLGQLGAVIENC